MDSFDIGAILFCDEVRKEATNKDIIIGVYGGIILVPHLPIQAPIALWIEVVPHRSGDFNFDVKLAAPGVDATFQMRFAITSAIEGQPLTFFTPQVGVPLNHAGDIVVSMKEAESEEWRIVKTKKVDVGKAPPVQVPQLNFGLPPKPTEASSTASEQPSEQSPPAVPVTKPRVSRRRPSAPRSGRILDLE